MEALFSVSVFVIAGVFLVVRWRSTGFGDAPLWYVFSSVVFINAGFLVRAIQVGGGLNRWAWDASVVVSLGLLFFMIGVTLRGMHSGAAGPNAPRAQRRRNTEDAPSIPLGPASAAKRLIVAAAVTMIPAWLYFVLLGYVPLFQGISAIASEGLGGAGALQAARLGRDAYVSAEARHIPMQGLMELARNIGSPMVASYAVSQWLRYGYSGLRLVVLVSSVVTVLLAGQRWPIAYLALALMAAISLSGGGRSLKTIGKLVPIVVVLGLATSVMQNRTNEKFESWGESIQFAAGNLINRIFYEQSYMSLASYEFAAFRAGELKGESYLMSLAAYVPGPGVSFPAEFYRRVTGVDAGWTAAPDFYTESYINFGLLGVVVVSLLWGAFVANLPRFRFSREPALQVGLQSGLLAVLAQSCYTGPVFTLGGFLMAAAILAAVRIFAPTSPHELITVRRSTRSSLSHRPTLASNRGR